MTTEFNCFDIFHLGDFLVLAQRLLVHAFVVVVARFLNKFDKISSIPGLAINVYSFVGTIFFCWGIVPFFIFHSQLFERKPAVVSPVKFFNNVKWQRKSAWNRRKRLLEIIGTQKVGKVV